MKAMFCMWSVPRGYLEDNWGDPGRNTALARASSIYKNRPVLSSGRALDKKKKTVTVKQ
jgi:hypothetical protein